MVPSKPRLRPATCGCPAMGNLPAAIALRTLFFLHLAWRAVHCMQVSLALGRIGAGRVLSERCMACIGGGLLMDEDETGPVPARQVKQRPFASPGVCVVESGARFDGATGLRWVLFCRSEVLSVGKKRKSRLINWSFPPIRP